MDTFNSSLLREKFTIYDPSYDLMESAPIIALSNRIVVPLVNSKGKEEEIFIVRAQNMHCCVRFAARILQSYRSGGSLLKRGVPFDWEGAWRSIVNDYEYAYNPQRWVAIYHAGHIIYESGKRNPFVDVIEKCDFDNEDEYDLSVPMAEEAFKRTGKVVKIDYSSNVALSVHHEDDKVRCGVILRGPRRTTTFGFTALPIEGGEELNIARCLTACAAFLEGIQLAYMLGMGLEKVKLGMIARFSPEEKQMKEAEMRLTRLSNEIEALERAFDIRYRSDKPNFHEIMSEAEEIAAKLFAPKDDEA